MVADNVEIDNAPPFTIVDNVLKGKVVRYKSTFNNVGALLLDKMRAHPDKIGQIDVVTDNEDTFASMVDRSVKCALWLKKQGIRRGDVISISTHNQPDAFVPCLAALYLGAIFNPWDHNMNTQLARYFMTLSKPKVIFANESSVGVVLEAAKIEVFNVKVVTFGDYPGAVPFAEILKGHNNSEVTSFRCVDIEDERDTATILHSSGTTGLPKGVQLSYYSLLYNLMVKNSLNMSNLVPLWFSTLYWISGTLLTLHSIFNVTTRIIPPEFDEELTCKIIEKYKVSWLFLGTGVANRFGKSGYTQKYDLSSLKILFVGGASLKREAQDELRKALPNVSVLQGYGMTELGGVSCNQTNDTTSGSCGIVSSNSELKIIDTETGVTLGPNATGEICVKLPTVMNGYYNNPEATKNTIDKEGWVHSGDIGYYNDKGELFIVDRLKEMIKFKGYQVSPSEIENLLITHPAVLEVAVVGVPHPTEDEHIVAFVSKHQEMMVSEQELIDLVANNLMDYCKLRGGVKFVENLPHTVTGKISRKDVKAMAKAMAV